MKKLFLFISIFTFAAFAQKSALELKSEFSSVNLKNKPSLSPNTLDNQVSKKKTGLAILYSLLLPGMGELYAESYSSGKYFTIAEGALWGVFIGMNSYANWQKDRYISFAASKGGVNTAGKDEEYFGIISEYVSADEYNNEKALERNFEDMYNSSHYYWNWGNRGNREQYRSMWVASEQTFNDIRFVVGAMIVNRIISAINAVRLVSAYNKRVDEEISWNLTMGISRMANLPHYLSISFQTSF